MYYGLIIGAGILSFLLFYFGSKLNEKEHFPLRLIVFGVGMVLLITLAKGVIDSQKVCEIVTHDHEFNYFQGSDYFAGLTIGAHQPNHVILNGELSFYLTVYDSKGIRQTNSSASCDIGVTDAQGDIIYINTSVGTYNGLDYIWHAVVPENILNHTGIWTFQLFCDDGTDGGFFNGEFDVTETGKSFTNSTNTELVCKDSPYTTGNVVYKIVSYTVILFIAYILFYFVYWLFANRMAKWVRKIQEMKRKR